MSKLEHFLDSQGRLTLFPAKWKMKVEALFFLAGKFEAGKRYTEREVNDLLNAVTTLGDPATLRRELYIHGFLGREKDCSAYWLEENQPEPETLLKKYG